MSLEAGCAAPNRAVGLGIYDGSFPSAHFGERGESGRIQRASARRRQTGVERREPCGQLRDASLLSRGSNGEAVHFGELKNRAACQNSRPGSFGSRGREDSAVRQRASARGASGTSRYGFEILRLGRHSVASSEEIEGSERKAGTSGSLSPAVLGNLFPSGAEARTWLTASLWMSSGSRLGSWLFGAAG
jgi:hypothetical protein